jgi:acrylyl-CoA reductase (NADPH)
MTTATPFTALRVHRGEGQPPVGRLDRITCADLNPGSVTVAVHYSAINYKDALAVTGSGAIMRRFPLVAGIDLAGAVVSSEDPRFAPGDPVLACGAGLGETRDGAYARYARVDADALVPLPAGLDYRDAAAIGTAGLTAALALERLAQIGQRPELGPLLVTGASGGVGSFAVDLAAGLGYEVVALTGKPGAASFLKALGARETLDRHTLELSTRSLGSARWGGAIDVLGGPLLAWIASTTVPNGSIACAGLAASPELNMTVLPLILRGVSLLGINSVALDPALRAALWQRLATDWRPRHLERHVSAEIALEQVPEVCRALMAGSHVGRTLVRLDS